MPASRKIIHLDMDAFYASIELRDRPDLRELPVAVGGGSHRGVVTTCNYVAREYGVRSAMPGFKARQLCPELIFLPLRFDLYREESARIRELMRRHTPLVEPLSLDEAYLDVTASDRFAWEIAKELRGQIFDETQLTASAGVAPNKMLAKIASDWRKPNGQFAVQPEEVDAFMRELPIKKVWGVGPKSSDRLASLGIRTCGDLQEWPLARLVAEFGRWGEELFRLCRGEDDREVQPNRIRKSLSNERTFTENLESVEACEEALRPLVRELREDLDKKAADRSIRKVYVIVKFANFQRTTRECVCDQPDEETCFSLLREAFSRGVGGVRLLGVGVRFGEEAPDTAQQTFEF